MTSGTYGIFLRPGELHITEKPTVVSTILGSCVSLTMFHGRTGTGGICHAILPKNPTDSGYDPFRYVDSVVSSMLKMFSAAGINRKEIEVKLFGGADVIAHNTQNTIGLKNITEALAVIARENLKLIVSDVGGDAGRKLFFYTHTGEVFMKRIENNKLLREKVTLQ
jgi:chemotaxis protein CheD